MNIKGAHVVFYRSLKSKTAFVTAVLLCKRTHDAPIHEGYWGLIGGTVDASEKPEFTATREVNEELGVPSSEFKMKFLCDQSIDREGSFDDGVRYFVAELDFGMDKLTLKPNSEGKVEGDGLGWFTADEIHQMLIRPEDRAAILEFFKI